MWVSAAVLLVTLIANLVANEPLHTDSRDEVIKERKQLRSLSYMKLPGIVRLQLLSTKEYPKVVHDKDRVKDLPKSFDAREKWPNCPSLKEIRDQGRCGSCWALSTAAAMTDRVCTYSNGTKKFHFSAEDLVSCSKLGGCRGGDPYKAWEFWVETGYVSGGNYGSRKGCKPYTIANCPNHTIDCTTYLPTPKCKRSCRDGYKFSYEKDKKHGKKVYLVSNVFSMMAELYLNGPFVVCFHIYEDFAKYTSGVYQHVDGKLVGAHGVKLMGWGVEKGKKYWLIANSWGTDFGEKGFFKILRGTDECGIESMEVSAGEPLLSDY